MIADANLRNHKVVKFNVVTCCHALIYNLLYLVKFSALIQINIPAKIDKKALANQSDSLVMLCKYVGAYRL